MTVTFKVDAATLEGSVSLVPEVLSDSTRFAPTCSQTPDQAASSSVYGSSPMGDPVAGTSECVDGHSMLLKADLRREINAIGDGKILAGLLQLLALLKQFGIIK